MECFSEKFLSELPDNVDEAMNALAVRFNEFDTQMQQKVAPEPSHPTKAISQTYLEYLTAYSVLIAYCNRSRKLNRGFAEMQPNKPQAENIGTIRSQFHGILHETNIRLKQRNVSEHLKKSTDYYADVFAKVSMYEFSDDDLARLQVLINELRTLINENKLLSEDHKRRLLKRLEAMQSELHKKTSDIDRFWGFVGEVGIQAKKFGENLKPITERVQEIGHIVLAVIYAKEGIQALPPANITNPLPLPIPSTTPEKETKDIIT